MKKPIPNIPDYFACTKGHIWSYKFGRWKKRKPFAAKSGHLHLTIKVNGKRKCFWVHRLVLEAFKGFCPPGKEARHSPDRNPANNRPTNLTWSSHAVNMRDMIAQGSTYLRDRHWNAKITPDDVQDILSFCKEFGRGSQTKMCLFFKVRKNTISDIIRKER